MSEYVKRFKDKDEDKDKNKNNKLTSVRIDDDKLLGKCKTISTKIGDLRSSKLIALPVIYDRFIKMKIRRNGNQVYTNSVI